MRTEATEMNGGGRIMLNTSLAVVLAVGMMIGLSMLTGFSQAPAFIQAEEPPKMEGGAGERSLVQEAAPIEEPAFAASEDVGGVAFVMADPVTLGTPFGLAFVAGLAAFLIVRSRIDRVDV